jgi:NAD(P)-dependent dehydrogenase (short-subunit alcohol dehydrogenase family)
MNLKVEAAQRLRGKVAVITGGGGTNSMGHSIGVRFAEEGAKVALADINGPSAALVADEIKAGGGVAMAIACDVTDLAQCEAMAKQVADTWGGRIDILVNNAAALKGFIGGVRPFDEWTTEEWDQTMAVNLRGMWYCAKAVVPYMKPHGYGKIINMASAVFQDGAPGVIHYTSSKAGVIGFTRGLGRELGDFGIRVNAISPGWCTTEGGMELIQGSQEFRDAKRMSQSLKERNGLPDDMAGPAVFLASEDSDFMTCQTLLVDGGCSMW